MAFVLRDKGSSSWIYINLESKEVSMFNVINGSSKAHVILTYPYKGDFPDDIEFYAEKRDETINISFVIFDGDVIKIKEKNANGYSHEFEKADVSSAKRRMGQ